MKIIFWGTPLIAVPFLQYLCKNSEVVCAVTRPDKPAQRGQILHKPPVKIFAEERKIPVLQPSALKDPQFIESLSAFKADCSIVVAYGRILPPEVIRIFPKSVYNVHFSLLPHLRGAAPMQWAILRGDTKTGVTIFRILETLDTGPVAAQEEIGILPTDNAISLEEKLVPLGLFALENLLPKIERGTVTEIVQTGESTSAPLLKKSDEQIDWNRPSEEIARQVRALVRTGMSAKSPNGKLLKIIRAEPFQHAPEAGHEHPGAVCGVEKGRGFLVKCKIGTLLITRVRLEGKKEMDAWSFLQGSRLKIGDNFH